MKAIVLQFLFAVALFMIPLGSSAQSDVPDDSAEELTEEARREALVSEMLFGMTDIPGKPFKLGRTEVTQGQWEAVMESNPSHFKGPDLPVEMVSWNDCQKFLKRLNGLPSVKESGLTFRLPTEAEWVFSCRAGAEGRYCKLADGTEITEESLDRVAWFEDNSDATTHPVGQKEPNAFGLYDMHGNVWEWTQTPVDESRVYRGGGWNDSVRRCVSSYWFWGAPGDSMNRLGLRLCAETRAD